MNTIRAQRTALGEAESANMRKGRALVGPMRNAQNVMDHGDGAAEANVLRHPSLRQAVGDDDERRDQQQPGQAARRGQARIRSSLCGLRSAGGAMPISLSADRQRVQTFCQMP